MPDFDATTPPGQPDHSASLPADVRSLELPAQYVVEAEIGRGGSGTVLRAHDTRHDRKVAIKVLRPEIAQDVGRDRFLREIRTAAQIVHPHIVSVFDSGTVNGTLYFVMPYIEGESLRSRLERKGALPLDEALRIAREIASALDCAHERGIVHRDIKPENILLSNNGHAWLADFGIARAATSATARLTQSGQVIGSPLYLSPEQARDDQRIDHRSDIYSLACVLYEMVAGAPAFAAGSMHAVLLKHLTRMPPRLRAQRPAVPERLDDVIQVGLAKDPADRFQTIAEFATQLAAITSTLGVAANDTARRLRPAGRRVLATTAWVVAAAIPVAIVLVVAARSDAFDRLVSADAALDTMRYIVLPVADSSRLPQLEPESRLADALRAWTGVDVVEPGQVHLADVNGGRAITKLARRSGAGRMIRGTVTRKADSLRIYLDLMDGNQPDVILLKLRRTYPVAADLDLLFEQVADSLLLRGVAPECTAERDGTRVLAAIHACDRAFSALYDGDVARADTFFQAALRHAPTYGRAALWLAHVRSWILPTSPDTRALVSIALADTASLSRRERIMARAFSDLSARKFASACALYRSLVAADSLDYAAWLGIGECHRRDNAVVRDPMSSSGWQFRTSYEQAVEAYRRAFELQPSLLGGYRERSFALVRDLFMTSTTSVRAGRAQSPDTTTFLAHPALQGDTLVLVPVAAQAFSQIQRGAVLPSISLAADRQKNILRQIASTWVRQVPLSAAAMEAFAVSLELAADATALDAMRKARSLARDSAEVTRLGAAEVWLGVKFGLPDRENVLRRSKALADSLLQNADDAPEEQARHLVSLALLTGRPAKAAELARRTAGLAAATMNLPRALVEPSRALLVFAAAGAPADSIQALERAVDRALSNGVALSEQARVREMLVTQAAMIAFPAWTLRALPAIAASGAFTEAEYALSRHDTVAARAALGRIAAGRAQHRPADMTIDGIYVEAWLRGALGEREQAAQLLDATLDALPWSPPGRLQDAARAGTLLRAMILRAELAGASRDRGAARRWARAANVFWSDAEPSLRQTVTRL